MYLSSPEGGMRLHFVETRVFTWRVQALRLEGELRALPHRLIEHPDAGDLDPGTGGLRKIRLGDPARGKGKRGGARVHYLWLPNHAVVYLMFIYTKAEADSLEPAQKRELRMVVDRIKSEWDRRAAASRRHDK
ncbi:MAG: addiction module toxin RelE [Gemmatimonadales bacterium]